MANVPHRTLNHAFPWNWAEAKANATLFSDFDPTGDGVTDDTTPFTNAVTAALSDIKFNGYHLLYIDNPGRFGLDNPVFDDVSDLIIFGDGDRSTFVELNAAWFTFNGYSNVGVLNLGFDAYGFGSFGGTRFVGGIGLWFCYNHMYNSISPGIQNPGALDLYAIVTTGGPEEASTNRNNIIEWNHFESLQPSFGCMKGFRFNHNRIARGGFATAGVGFWGNNNDWMIEDGDISYNKFIDCGRPALMIGKDTASALRNSFQRLAISYNEFDFYSIAQMGLQYGSAEDTFQQETDTFKDWWIIGNKFRWADSCPTGNNAVAMKAIVPADSFVFDHFTVQGNESRGRLAQGAMLLYAMKNSFVESNDLPGATLVVDGVPTIPANNVIRDNVANYYYLRYAHGNTTFTGNREYGRTAVAWTQTDVDGTGNDIDDPTLITVPSGFRLSHNFSVGNAEGWNPASLDDGQSASQIFAFGGITNATFRVIFVQFSGIATNVNWTTEAVVSADDEVTVKITNHTGGTVNLDEGDTLIILEKL